MSIDGKSFTYVNQLASSEGYPSKREDWFECACCPPNVARVLGHLSGYMYTAKTESSTSAIVNVHLFAASTLEYKLDGSEEKVVRLMQTTNYPWDGGIAFELETDPDIEVAVRVRIPGWAESYEVCALVQLHPEQLSLIILVKITPAPESKDLKDGYLYLPGSYLKANPKFKLSIPLTPRLIRPHPYTNQSVVALARGPIVYCIEDTDHTWVEDHFKVCYCLFLAMIPHSNHHSLWFYH